MKISNTRLDLYNQCPKKFYFSYVEKLTTPVVYSSLIFGKAIDESLNYLLECKKDNKEIELEKAHTLFVEKLHNWDKSFKLHYYKKEVPKEALDFSDREKDLAVLDNLKNIGIAVINTYNQEILPKFKSIKNVQIEKVIKNEEDDELIMIIDFIAELEDGKIILFDNKTTGNMTSYRDVKNSQQLALYSEHFNVNHCGYIVLNKAINENGLVNWEMIIDEPLETKREEVYSRLCSTLDQIKNEEFSKNEKSCFAYGKRCEFYSYCKYGNKQGLIQK